jgi:hypothetical protein
MKKTKWFPAHNKPTLKGVYETRDNFGDPFLGYQYWNGRSWRFWGFDANDAYRCRETKSIFQKVEWRGLASDPRGSK